MTVGFKVDSNIVSLRGVVEVLDTGRDASDRNVSLTISLLWECMPVSQTYTLEVLC